MTTYSRALSLSANIAAFGFTHVAAGHGRRAIVDTSGAVVFTGCYEDVRTWLCGVDLTPLRAEGWEVRFDGDGRPVIRKDTRGAGWCVIKPQRWPWGPPGSELRLCDWHAEDNAIFEEL